MLQFSWEAFAFAIVNFLILVALLYRFLHKPLLAALEKRRKGIEDAGRKAREETEKAQQTWKEYQDRLAAVDQERERILSEARAAADEARESMLAKAREETERKVAGLKRAYERERQDALKGLQDEVAAASLDIASGILQKLVDAELEAKLHTQLLAELDAVESREHLADATMPVRVSSARELGDEQRREIAQRVGTLAGTDAPIDFEVDEALIAGARVEFSSIAVNSTLSDVLDSVRTRLDELAGESENAGEGKTEGGNEQ